MSSESIEICPFCSGHVSSADECYSASQIIDLWALRGVDLLTAGLEQFDLHQEMRLFNCDICGFGQFRPMWAGTGQFYSAISALSDYYLPDKWEYEMAMKDLHNVNSLLEVGCGDGRFLEKLIQKGKSPEQLLGIELNPEAVQVARNRGISVRNSSLNEIASQHEGAFEAVCAFQVLEHVADPSKFIRLCVQCLQPGGMLLLAVPNADGCLKYVRPIVTDMPPHHVTRWRQSTFYSMEKLGVRVQHVYEEPLDAFRFHWLNGWWKKLWAQFKVRSPRFAQTCYPVQYLGGFMLHHSLLAAKSLGIQTLPFSGHSLYALFIRSIDTSDRPDL